jgi:hypothetical protein
MNYSGMTVSPDISVAELLFLGSGVHWKSGEITCLCIEDIWVYTGLTPGVMGVNGKHMSFCGNTFEVWATIMRELCGTPE